jgi:Sec-independent protein translocase protein TatA
MVILILAVIVVGPERLPAVAADLARWIRQARSYARYMMKDFNSVVAELEKEANVNRDDWKEIASVVTRHTGDIGKELNKVTRDLEDTDLEAAKAAPEIAATNGTHNGAAESAQASANGSNGDAQPAEEKPWYVPEKPRRASRRRSNE